jgi:alpha/beta superfamily hydrolase
MTRKGLMTWPRVARPLSPARAVRRQGRRGDESDLKLLESSIQRQASGLSRVNTVVIHNADHMYTGEEAQVAGTITRWADSVVLSQSGSRNVPGKQ